MRLTSLRGGQPSGAQADIGMADGSTLSDGAGLKAGRTG
jgi:hypothetical protein